MNLLMRAIAITAFCIFSSTKSIEVITAYDGISTIDDACSSSESYGRSHRFYFTLGERGDGDRLLKVLQKHITYRTETNTTVNIVYPEPNHEGLSLSYVLVKVYQGSDINRIHLVDGGVGQKKLSIDIYANNTKYVLYNATLYGMY